MMILISITNNWIFERLLTLPNKYAINFLWTSLEHSLLPQTCSPQSWWLCLPGFSCNHSLLHFQSAAVQFPSALSQPLPEWLLLGQAWLNPIHGSERRSSWRQGRLRLVAAKYEPKEEASGQFRFVQGLVGQETADDIQWVAIGGVESKARRGGEVCIGREQGIWEEEARYVECDPR